jgi:hypothetical protein
LVFPKFNDTIHWRWTSRKKFTEEQRGLIVASSSSGKNNQVIYFSLNYYSQNLFGQIFPAHTIICAGFLRHNIITDRTKLRLLYSVYRALHRALATLGSSPVMNSTSRTQYIRVLTHRGSTSSIVFRRVGCFRLNAARLYNIGYSFHVDNFRLNTATCDYIECVRHTTFLAR